MSSPLREVLSRRPEPSVEEFFDDPDSFQLPPGFFDSSPERSVSRIMDVVSFVLRETGMPPTHRAFVDALIGVADGRLDWFEASDFTIGKRARPKTDIKRESIESWTMRARKRFVKWQETFGITIIECMPGGKLNGENFTSRYRLPVLEIAAEVIKQATGHPLWQTQPERAIRRATQETIKKHGGGLHGVARQERFTRNMPDIDQFEKTFLAYGRKVTGQAMLRSEDPRQRLDRVYRQLMAELIPQDDHVQSSLLIQEETVHGESGEWVTDLSPIAPVSNQKGDKLVTLPVNSVKRHETPPGRLAEMAADAFGSVGANISLAVFLDDSKPKGEQKTWDLTFGSVAAFKVKIPALLERSEMKRESMAARVTGDHIVHLDDCDTQDELRLRGFSFLTVMTSPGNFQCWLALAGVEIGHRDEIRERLINKLSNTGSTANRGSSGSMRWPGTRNWKQERRQPDGSSPMVKIISVNSALTVPISELDEAELLGDKKAKPQPVRPSRPIVRSSDKPPVWPDWNHYAALAPRRADGKVDRSAVDMSWCMASLRRGFSESEVESELCIVSPKAAQATKHYVRLTVRKAGDGIR